MTASPSPPNNAIANIGAVLPTELRHLLTDNAFHVGRNRPQTPAVDLSLLRQAMREQFKLHIAYKDPAGGLTQRIIWPIMLGFIEDKRLIAGWCELRQDFRYVPRRSDRARRTLRRALSRPPSRPRQALANNGGRGTGERDRQRHLVGPRDDSASYWRRKPSTSAGCKGRLATQSSRKLPVPLRPIPAATLSQRPLGTSI